MAKESKTKKVAKKIKKAKQKDDIKRLYKSQYDRMIGGVAGGIAEYLKVDSTIIRIVFVLMSLFGGTGIIIYIAGLFIIPEGDKEVLSDEKVKSKRNNTGFWGILLIIAGLLFILPDIGYVRMHRMWIGSDFWDLIIPVMVIGLGAWLLLRPSNPLSTLSSKSEKSEVEEEDKDGDAPKSLKRSRVDKKIAGVCGGVGEYFGIDSTIVRILWVLATLASAGFGILAYLIFMVIISRSDETLDGAKQ